MSSDNEPNISQLQALLLALPDPSTPDLNPPNWPIPPPPNQDVPPPPSPFEDYQHSPFHWTGESLKPTPIDRSATSSNANRAKLIAQFPLLRTSQMDQSCESKPSDVQKTPRKKRFRQLRRAISLTHIRHKPTPPDTAPPTPTVPTTAIPSSSTGLKSLESLAHWQLPDPTIEPTPLDANSIFWPPSLAPSRSTPHSPFIPPLDQLSPPSSIPSESDILPPDVLAERGIAVSFTVSPSVSPAPSPRSLYPPSMFDSLDLSNPEILEKDAKGKVIAGTPEGLVAYITSPDCLDYDVLSDFFLMYRKIMEPTKLLYLLCARFEWALIRGIIVRPPDNEGMVRVRTFAALRHWLLNYFADDFAPSPTLRTQFVKAINAFCRDPRVRGSTRDTRIISELKRCWRRVCSIYWDGQQGRKSTFGGFEADITDGQKFAMVPDEGLMQGRNRVPSLLLRATKEREERLGTETSKSQPDLRKRFMEVGPVNSTRKHTRIHSASSIQTPSDTRTRHRRNHSDETPVIYSKNASPSLFHSFARGDGQQDWPSSNVRPDLLVTSPTTSSPTSVQREKRRFFRSKRKKIATEGSLLSPTVPKSATSMSFSCTGQLSDDEEKISGRAIRNTVPFVSGGDRVDFLAAGMWPSFLTATSMDSQVNLKQAEQLGEALVQGLIQPAKVDDESALEVAAVLDKGKAVETIPVGEITTSTDDQLNPATLSMTEIERRLEVERPPSMPSSSRSMSSQYQRLSERFSIIPTPPPTSKPPEPPVRGLRRRPGGNLRLAQNVNQLDPPRDTVLSFASSISELSSNVPEDVSQVDIPSMSIEDRSLYSLLDIRRSEFIENKSSYSPPHRTSGMAMDFTQFHPPSDIESSDDEDCDPITAMEKTLLKLEGKYVRKNRRSHEASDSNSQNARNVPGPPHDILSTDEISRVSTSQYSVGSDAPPEGIMVERSAEDLWRRRHKHIVDGQEFGTPPIHHGPFTDSSLYEFMTEEPIIMDQIAEMESETETDQEVQDLYIQVPTLESAIAELERNQLAAQRPRIPSTLPPKPPENQQRSLSSHLPFILQYDSLLLAKQFTLIEKDILAEVDWTELIEPTWMDRNPELVDVRDWKGFVTRDEGEGGLHTVIARFNLMAGWTTSEVILTQSIAERTMVISKFIHVATACRRLRNFATLTQIVVGLQSQHLTGLTATWEGLSVADMKLWQELQRLVDSSKNWSKMRHEMEDSSLGPRRKGEGCIPFLGRAQCGPSLT